MEKKEKTYTEKRKEAFNKDFSKEYLSKFSLRDRKLIEVAYDMAYFRCTFEYEGKKK